MIPSASAIAAHWPRGGLWRTIPKQGAPSFAVLGIAGNVRTYNGGDLVATVEDNQALQGAEWVPCNRKGDRIE